MILWHHQNIKVFASTNENEEKSRSDKAVNEGMEVPYPVVPSKKKKDHHLARFLDIFRNWK